MASFSTIVNASLNKVWEHLLYKIEHPEAFVPGVSDVIILDKNDDFVMRQMTITMNDSATKVIEKITASPFRIRFELVEHPKFEGFVDNEAVPISDNETQITYTMHWIDKHTKVAFDNPEGMKNAVLKTKDYIETNL
ncbi:MAG: AtaL-like protein [Bacteroidota bacterium]